MKRVLHLLGLAAILASFASATSVRIEMLPDNLGVRLQTVGFGLSTDGWSNSEPSVVIRALLNDTPLAVITPPSGTASIVDKLKSISGRVVFENDFSVDFTISTNEDPFVSLGTVCSNSSVFAIACQISPSTPVIPGAYSYSSLSFGVTLTAPVQGGPPTYTATNIQATGSLGTDPGPVYAVDLQTPVPATTLTAERSNTSSDNWFVDHSFAPRTDITAMKGEFNILVPRRGSAGTVTQVSTSGVYNLTPVPEPGTFAMLGLGLLGLAFAVRRRAN